MNWLVAASLFWVFASVTVALLPMRFQYAPGLRLVLAAPVLMAWIACDVGSFAAAAALVAFLSMYRNPVFYLVRKAIGLPVRRPAEPPEAPQ